MDNSVNLTENTLYINTVVLWYCLLGFTQMPRLAKRMLHHPSASDVKYLCQRTTYRLQIYWLYFLFLHKEVTCVNQQRNGKNTNNVGDSVLQASMIWSDMEKESQIVNTEQLEASQLTQDEGEEPVIQLLMFVMIP